MNKVRILKVLIVSTEFIFVIESKRTNINLVPSRPAIGWRKVKIPASQSQGLFTFLHVERPYICLEYVIKIVFLMKFGQIFGQLAVRPLVRWAVVFWLFVLSGNFWLS